jgi:hypothetical protein
MNEACSANEIDKKCIKMLVGKSDWKYHLEDQGVDGTIILKLISNRKSNTGR